MDQDAAPFPYMRWAKACLQAGDEKSLGLSGRPRPGPDAAPDLVDLDVREIPALRRAWVEALAGHLGLDPSWVYPTLGTSHANFLVYLAFARGGHVAVETPAYESLPRTADAVGATLATFRRERTRRGRIDADGLRQAARPGTRLIALTDLHNPSGMRLDEKDLDLVLEIAEARDALVLVDEVYLDLDPRDRPSAASGSARVISTSSLTKTYGLGDLRAGWAAGAPERMAQLAYWDDLVCPSHPPGPIAQAMAFLPHARRLLHETRRWAERATDQVDAWIASRPDARWTRPDGGFTGLVDVGVPGRPIDGSRLAEVAWTYEALRVVPGAFFQVPNAIRISYLKEPEPLADALERLGRALDRVG